MKQHSHLNDNSKPLIILGSSTRMEKIIDLCDNAGIQIYGIIDRHYYGNTDEIEGVPVVDSEDTFSNENKKAFYKQNYNFFVASNANPFNELTIAQDRRNVFLDLIKQNDLNCISLIDNLSKINSSASIGKGVLIDCFVMLEPHTVVEDFCTIYPYTGIAHHTTVGRNTTLQGRCSITSDVTIEENCFISNGVMILKSDCTISKNTVIDEAIYIRRGTIENEKVKQNGKNMKRVKVYEYS